jgi:hypothetical protein
MVRAVLAVVALAFGATQASAQITTYVAPPRPAATSPQMIAVADSVRRDSVAQATMTNMKVWVDSAAGVSVPAHVGDSVSVVDPGAPVTTTFSEGSVAPATASTLPALAVLGLVCVVLGAALLAHRPRG